MFGGDRTDLFFLNAKNGNELWWRNVGGLVNTAPSTYTVNGEQYFAIAAGQSIVDLAIDY